MVKNSPTVRHWEGHKLVIVPTAMIVKPITRSVKGIPNAFAIGYTQSKINRHAKKAFKAQQPTVDPKQMEIDFS